MLCLHEGYPLHPIRPDLGLPERAQACGQQLVLHPRHAVPLNTPQHLCCTPRAQVIGLHSRFLIASVGCRLVGFSLKHGQLIKQDGWVGPMCLPPLLPWCWAR